MSLLHVFFRQLMTFPCTALLLLTFQFLTLHSSAANPEHPPLHPNTCLLRSNPPSSLFALTQPICLIPIDDESPPHLLSQTPWSYPPYCLPSTSGSTSSSSSSSSSSSIPVSDKLCVYTSTSFNQGVGISIIAHPETVATLVSGISNSTASYNARVHIAHAGRNDNTLPYIVTPIPGKGIGVIATRQIAQFETIMVSFPALVIDDELFPDDEDDDVPVEGPRLFTRALGQLSDSARVLGLARSKGSHIDTEQEYDEDGYDEDGGGGGGGWMSGKVHIVEDIVRTNAFGIYTVDGRDFKGLYPEIARINHGCDPNAYGRYTKGDLAMSAVATRDIEPGEEITISYIPLGMPSTYRKQALTNWSFVCTCALCSSPESALSASDSRRNRLPELLHFMNQLIPASTSTQAQSIEETQASYDKLVSYTREFVDLVQIERLFPKVGEFYQQFMRLYFAFGDVESAYKYARTALKFAEIFSDPEGGFCVGLRRDLEYLQGILAERGGHGDEAGDGDGHGQP